MTYVTATYPDVAPFQLPKFPVRRSRSIAAKGLLAGTAIVAAGGVLAASLGLSALWMSAVSLNAPTRLHANAPVAPLVSALGEWHRGLMRPGLRSGSGNGFGNAPDTPEFAALAPEQTRVVAPQPIPVPPRIAPAPTIVPKPFARVPLPRPRAVPHVAAPPVATALPQPVSPQPQKHAEAVPLPLARPFILQPVVAEKPPAVAVARAVPAPEPEPKVAALPPAPAPKNNPAAAGIDKHTAVYDIEAHTVYLPNGRRLEAHSGLGHMMDDPDFIRAKMRGPTPPNVYALTLRQQLFHGVRAIRLTPVDERKMYGRDGMLAHTYMLGPNGQSNGCVSFRNYNTFLQAYLDGQVDRMVVVPRLDAKTRAALALPAPRWNLFSAFAAE